MPFPPRQVLDPQTKEIAKEFTFDYSYNSFVDKDAWDHASNETVWLDLGLEALANAWEGYNVSIFAYGQTGSGKTYRRVRFVILPLRLHHLSRVMAP